MKKFIIFFLCIVMVFSSALLIGCDNNGEDPYIPPVIDDNDDDDDEFDTGDDVVDETNFDTVEAGFTMDGVIDETEKAKYITLAQHYGVEGQMVVSYYIGDKGLYFHFNVSDPIVFKGSETENRKGSSSYTMESDRVELFIDTLNDKGTSPKADDYHILVSFEGYYIVRKGTGSAFNADGTIGIDDVGTYYSEDTSITSVSERDSMAEENPRSTQNIDEGYQVEFFMSYQNFGFSKRTEYGVSIGQSDMWNVVQASRFNVAGSNVSPAEFRTLSNHGFGTKVALEQNIVIDGVQDAFYTTANVASNNYLYRYEATRAWGQNKGNMTTETYIYLGQNGMYIFMKATSAYLRYYYNEFPYFSDHVEIRIDSNNSESTNATAEGDRWFFQDIVGAQQTAYGIDNGSRAAGSYDLIAATKYTGEIVDANGAPIRNSGSKEDKTFIFEAFFPYYAINVSRGATFGLMMVCGNPDEGASGIGSVFYTGTSYAVDKALWHTFEHYANYTKFTTPAP